STAIPIVHGSVDFFRPIFCGDKLVIQIIPQQLSDNEFEIAYQIFVNTDSQTCCAKAKTRHVCINLTDRRRTQLPESMIHWLHELTLKP
ncbi:MAG: acyl-CoA thioesterase, partial [Microcystaceae cyanobacterium]